MAKTAACPSCGAPVVFRSVASVLAVCEYCQSTLVRQGTDLENLGKMAAFLDDRSPLQLGTEGRWNGRHFGLIGRLQLRYDAGHWNEWHLLFDDGRSGWLSEAGGELVISEPMGLDGTVPAFEAIALGDAIRLRGHSYTVTNILPAECVAGAGELPFKVGGGYPAPLVDLRDSTGRFATLDYSDAADMNGRPLVFLGEAIEAKALALANLRDPAAASGKPTVKAKVFQCPSCGGPLSARSPDILTVGCGSCGALIDTGKEVAKQVAKVLASERFEPLLPLGATGTLRGEALEVIGVMQRRMTCEGVEYFWREYVLTTPDGSVRWLTEYDGHWNLARVLAKSVAALGTTARYNGQSYRHFQTYTAYVDHVEGEFPWRVRAYESAQVHDYVAPPAMLSREVTDRESTWTQAEYLDPEELGQAFSQKTLPEPRGVHANQPNPHAERHGPVMRHFWQLFLAAWLIHLLLLVFGPGDLLKENVAYSASSDARLSPEFALPDGARRLEVAHEARFRNSWAAFNMTLVNKTTGESWQAQRELSYYEGVDGGESWSEGSKSDEVVFADLQPGTYMLAEDIETEPGRQAVVAELRVARPGPRWSSLLILLLGLAIVPLYTFTRHRTFEVARWAESDHPIVSASDDDDA